MKKNRSKSMFLDLGIALSRPSGLEYEYQK